MFHLFIAHGKKEKEELFKGSGRQAQDEAQMKPYTVFRIPYTVFRINATEFKDTEYRILNTEY